MHITAYLIRFSLITLLFCNDLPKGKKGIMYVNITCLNFVIVILISLVVANLQDCERGISNIKVSGNINSVEIKCKFEVTHTSQLARDQGCSSIFFKDESDGWDRLPPKPKSYSIIKQPNHQVNLTWQQFDYRNHMTKFGGFLIELKTYNNTHGNKSCLLFYANTKLDLKQIGKNKVSFYIENIPVDGTRMESSIWAIPWEGRITNLCNKTTGCELLFYDLNYYSEDFKGLVQIEECECSPLYIENSLVGNELEISFCPLYRNAHYLVELIRRENQSNQIVHEILQDGHEMGCNWTVGELEAGCYQSFITRYCKKNPGICIDSPKVTEKFCIYSVNVSSIDTHPAPDNPWIYVGISVVCGVSITICFMIIISQIRKCRGRRDSDQLIGMEARNLQSDFLLAPQTHQLVKNNKLLLIFTRDSDQWEALAVSFAEVLKMSGYDIVYDELDLREYSRNTDEWAERQSSTCDTVIVLLSKKLFLFVEALRMRSTNADTLKERFMKSYLDPSLIAVMLHHVQQKKENRENIFVVSFSSGVNALVDNFVSKYLPLVPKTNKLCLSDSNLGEIVEKTCRSQKNSPSVLKSSAFQKMQMQIQKL